MQTIQASRLRLWSRMGAFALPCIIMAAVLATIGIYPFGDKSLLIIDMNSEYVDYLAQMNESVRTGGSLLRSWNMGMGLNMLGLIAFYTASPFNILVLIFPVEYITEVLFGITLLKIGLAGLLFALYTEYVFRRAGIFAVVFSVAYALNAYHIAYASNIMWLDGAAFLPLVLLGVEKLLREGRSGMLLFSFAYVFFSSYYIGYMIGVFSLLYLIAAWLASPRPARMLFGKICRLIGTAALAGGCCAFLLLPAFLNLKHGQMEMFLLDLSPELQKPFVHILSRMLPGAYDTLTDAGYPNIYCTVLGLLLCVVFFTHSRIPRRHKLVNGSLLGFLLFSFSCRTIYLAWHAFEDPTWFPARYSFVFCFWVLYLAMHAATELKSLSVSGMAGAVCVLLLLTVEVGAQRLPNISAAILLTGGLLTLLYFAIWMLARRRGYRWLVPLVLLLVCAEAGSNALVMEQGLDREFQYRTRSSYTDFRRQYEPVLEQLNQRDTDVYRLEFLEQRNANGGMALGYNGISHYSTTTDQALNTFLRGLGYNRGTENELRFAQSTPLTNGLLGIKYVLSRQDLGEGYFLLETVGDVGVYENLCAFPLAFWTQSSVPDIEIPADRPFALQNALLEAIGLGADFFVPIADIEFTLHNLDREQQEEGYLLYSKRVRDEPAYVQYTIHNPYERQAYAYFPVWNRRFSRGNILVDDTLVQQDLRYRRNAVARMGDAQTIALTLALDSYMARIDEEQFYTLDLEAAVRAASGAWEHAMVFDAFTDTRVVGRISAPHDGFLVTTFPYDSGWTVLLDGEKVEAQRFASVFVAVPLTEGLHSIEMRYFPPGFLAGCWISSGCLAGIAVYAILRIKKKSMRIESGDNP